MKWSQEDPKSELLEKIEKAYRQLERYIYYYQRDEHGQGFSASDRPKFSREEMLKPGVWGQWSLKDLLAYIVQSEQQLTALLEENEVSRVASPLLISLDWEQRLDAEQVPQAVQDADLDEVLVDFPASFQKMYAKLLEIPKEALFTPGAYQWAGGHAAADFVRLMTVALYDWVKGLVRKWRKRHAGQQLNKEVILVRIRSERGRLEKNLATIPLDEMEDSGVVGEWSVKDLLAHLVEWERMFTGWYEAGLRSEVPEIPAPGYSWKKMNALNEKIYQKHRERPLAQVLEEFKESYEQIYALVEGMSEEEIFTAGRYEWVEKGSLAGYILANTGNHYRWAKDKLRAWRKQGES